jgi:hypothetical protein
MVDTDRREVSVEAMDTKPGGASINVPANCEHLIGPGLFWVLLAALAVICGIVLAIAIV